ncbi:hypothetical protein CISIN_1g032142mg [Citrus sinensis]|uniref:Uncharacterized protein n=1 Tax=Citrus sinensis TaxID=2711 RepID=A0A067ERE3_CITSI|nr:hypothetical protein CISIN_1g032142mg [Citrus sinensis]
MYSIVMRPESLPKSYQDLIQKTGPVAKPVYKAVRDCCRGGPVDVASISAYLSSRGKLNVMKLEEFPSIIPCSIIHPETDSCLGHNAKAASATFRKTFPLYFFPDIYNRSRLISKLLRLIRNEMPKANSDSTSQIRFLYCSKLEQGL